MIKDIEVVNDDTREGKIVVITWEDELRSSLSIECEEAIMPNAILKAIVNMVNLRARQLEEKIEHLKEFKWMYEDLQK